MAVVAPASPFTRDDFDRGITEVTALGFEPVYDDRVFARRNFVAGEPEARAAAFLEAWEDPTIAGVLCVRGGYGSVQILPFLDLARMQAHAESVRRLQRRHVDAHVSHAASAASSPFTGRCWRAA